MRLEPEWLYVQDSGYLYWQRAYITTGYAGQGKGLNNADYQHVVGIGPIPRGRWLMGRAFEQHPTSATIRLTACPETEAEGRSGFLIHGGRRTGARTASRGCIILPKHVRQRMMSRRGLLLVARRSDSACGGLWEPLADRMVL
jgi:hypothetical protein